jgi:hypothetical protein
LLKEKEMRIIVVKLLVVLLIVFGFGLNAHAVTIDFDTLPGMYFSSSNFTGVVPIESQLSDQLHTSTGAVFSTLSSGVAYVAVVDIDTNFDPPWGGDHSSSPPNAIGGVDTYGRLRFAESIQVEFFDPLNRASLATTDYVSITGDNNQAIGWLQIEAFDVDGVAIGSDRLTESSGTTGLTVNVSAPDIHRIVISSQDGNIAWDDLTFNTVTAVVPEPSSLLLIGTGLLGLVGIRKAL